MVTKRSEAAAGNTRSEGGEVTEEQINALVVALTAYISNGRSVPLTSLQAYEVRMAVRTIIREELSRGEK